MKVSELNPGRLRNITENDLDNVNIWSESCFRKATVYFTSYERMIKSLVSGEIWIYRLKGKGYIMKRRLIINNKGSVRDICHEADTLRELINKLK